MADVSQLTDQMRTAIEMINQEFVPEGYILIVRPRYPLGAVEANTYYIDEVAGLVPVDGAH